MEKFKNKQAGFTLAELLISATLLVVIVGLIIPVAIHSLPDADKDTIKHVYYQLASVIQSMTTDPYLYPTGRFDAPKNYSRGGVDYSASEKFAKAFASRLNILKVENKNTPDVVPMGYQDEEYENPIALGGNESVRIITNNRISYYIPKNSVIGAFDRFAGENTSVVIKVFLEKDPKDHNIYNGYYFVVNKFGKISVLPADEVTSRGTPSGQCNVKEVYQKYKQCKLDSYLKHTN